MELQTDLQMEIFEMGKAMHIPGKMHSTKKPSSFSVVELGVT